MEKVSGGWGRNYKTYGQKMKKVRIFLENFYQQLESDPVLRQEYLPTSISQTQGMLLRSLIEYFKPKSLLEIGCAYGLSMLWIESAQHKLQKHIVLDPFQNEFGYQGQKLVKKFKLSSIKKILPEKSQIYLPKLIEKNEKIECFFIDGSNLFDQVLSDLQCSFQILPVGGVMILRNTWNPSIFKAILFMLYNMPVRVWNLAIEDEKLFSSRDVFSRWLAKRRLRRYCRVELLDFCVLVKVSEDNRKWNHFIDF